MLLVYFFPVFDIGFLLLAVPTYLFLFRMFKQTRTHRPSALTPATITPRIDSTKSPTTIGWCTAFRESTFYTAALLVAAFIMFVIIPDLVILFVPLPVMSPHLRLLCALLPRELSFVVDAWIYMLTMKKVRTMWKRALCRLGCCKSNAIDVIPAYGRTTIRRSNGSS